MAFVNLSIYNDSVYNVTSSPFLNFTNQTNVTFTTMPMPCLTYTDNTGHIIYAVFLALVLLLCLLGNSLICFAIALSPRLRETPTNYFIVSLAISDMCYAIFQCPLRIFTILHNRAFCASERVCYLLILTDIICTPATISTLFVIAIDRCFCIVSPFFYQEHMTKGKAKIIILGVWVYAAIWASLSTFSWHSPFGKTIGIKGGTCMNNNPYFYLTSYFIVTLIPLVVMAFTYVVILRVAVIQIRAIRATEVHIPQENIDRKDKKYAKMSKSSRRTNREFKATATLAIVYGAFFVCWFPPCIINIVIGFKGASSFKNLQSTNPPLFNFIYYTFMEVLPTLSTAINPIIYNIFNRQFRAAFKAVFFRISRNREAQRTIIQELEISRFDHNGRTTSTR